MPMTADPCDDGSSTESEYYYDPIEDAEEEAVDAWTHEQEPAKDEKEDRLVIKQERCGYGHLQQDAKGIALPQGSEWSHGAASTTAYDNAVERALNLAQELTRANGEDPGTDDTVNSNDSFVKKDKESDKKKQRTMKIVGTRNESVRPKLVSLASVKASSSSPSNSMEIATGLRQTLSIVKGAPSELHKQLSVSRPQWKPNKSGLLAGQKASLPLAKSKLNDENTELPVRSESITKSPSVRRSESKDSSLNRRSEISKSPPSQTRCHGSKSETVETQKTTALPRRTAHVIHRERSASPPRRFCRRGSIRHRNDELKRRSRSRSPHRFAAAAVSSRSCRAISVSNRHEYALRPSLSYKRSRSPLPQDRRIRSRSRTLERQAHRSFQSTRYDMNARFDHQICYDVQGMDSRRPSLRDIVSESRASHQEQNTMHGQSRDDHFSRTPCRDIEKSRLQREEQNYGSGRVPDLKVSISNMPKVVQFSKRSPRDPRVRHQVEQAVTPRDSKSPPVSENCDSIHTFLHRVYKLKLQLADLDEILVTGPRSAAEKSLLEQRINKVAHDQARLLSLDSERFEREFARISVTANALKRYQYNRDFAWRIARYKERLALFQHHNDLKETEEAKLEKWRQLDAEREELVNENTAMFHRVMMTNTGNSQPLQNASIKQPSLKATRASGDEDHQLQPPYKRHASESISSGLSCTSRVVVGAALRV